VQELVSKLFDVNALPQAASKESRKLFSFGNKGRTVQEAIAR
jgi:hypothetical protein